MRIPGRLTAVFKPGGAVAASLAGAPRVGG